MSVDRVGNLTAGFDSTDQRSTLGPWQQSRAVRGRTVTRRAAEPKMEQKTSDGADCVSNNGGSMDRKAHRLGKSPISDFPDLRKPKIFE